MKLNSIPVAAVRRLSLYLRQLEAFQQAGTITVSSRQLGDTLAITDAQVRKDLAYFGQFGHPGLGYKVDDLITRIRHILGTDKTWNVVVIGAGNLGRALLQYRGFGKKGFHVVAAFDSNSAKVGQFIGGTPVLPMEDLPRIVQERGVRLALLAVPAESAQEVCNQLARAGVMGVLNFAPINLAPSPPLAVNAVDLAVQLEQLSFQVTTHLETAETGKNGDRERGTAGEDGL